MPTKIADMQQPTGQVTSMPEPEAKGNFLKPDIFKSGKGKIVLAGNVHVSTGQFSQYDMDVKVGKTVYTLGLKIKSGNYARIFEKCGADPEKWKNKTFNVEVSQHMGKDYVKIVD